MNTYIISYDLRDQKNYPKLYEAIKTYWTRAKILDSVWVVKSSETASWVFTHLSKFTDSDDGLFVIKSWYNAHWKNLECSDEWLQKNL